MISFDKLRWFPFIFVSRNNRNLWSVKWMLHQRWKLMTNRIPPIHNQKSNIIPWPVTVMTLTHPNQLTCSPRKSYYLSLCWRATGNPCCNTRVLVSSKHNPACETAPTTMYFVAIASCLLQNFQTTEEPQIPLQSPRQILAVPYPLWSWLCGVMPPWLLLATER